MNPSGDPPAAESGTAGSWQPRRHRLARFAVPLVAAAVLTAGMVLLAQPVQQQSLGWFAYAPLSQQAFIPQGVLVMDAGKWAGVWLTGLGLLALAFWAGYRTGQRPRRRRGA